MIRLAITPAAYEAICSTLPNGAPLPVQRHGGRCLSTVWRPCAGRERTIATSSFGLLNWRGAGARAPGRFRIGVRPRREGDVAAPVDEERVPNE